MRVTGIYENVCPKTDTEKPYEKHDAGQMGTVYRQGKHWLIRFEKAPEFKYDVFTCACGWQFTRATGKRLRIDTPESN